MVRRETEGKCGVWKNPTCSFGKSALFEGKLLSSLNVGGQPYRVRRWRQKQGKPHSSWLHRRVRIGEGKEDQKKSWKKDHGETENKEKRREGGLRSKTTGCSPDVVSLGGEFLSLEGKEGW